MPNQYKTLFALILSLFLHKNSVGQSDSTSTQKNKKYNFETNLGAELNSSYFWRGSYNDPKPNIQPTLDLSINDFTFTLFGSNNFDNSYQEFDYTIAYKIKNITISLSDYYFDFTKNYFDYSINSSHLVDATVEFEKGEKHVFGALLSCLIWGNDKQKDYKLTNKNNQNYSTYVQTSYTINFDNKAYSFILGASTHRGMYADKCSITNIGFEFEHNIQITKTYACTPIFGLWVNPTTEQIFFNYGVRF